MGNKNDKAYCTIAIAAANVIVFLYLSFGGMTENGEYMLAHGAMYVPYILENGEYYYCLFYLLNQVYLTTKTWELEQVMPLAIVESYHSERIRAQKGAFTIFPYYKETSEMTNLEKVGIELDAMENMHNDSGFLHKILICNQDEVAFEIMNAGLNVSWLYPEMPVVANAIENRRIIF